MGWGGRALKNPEAKASKLKVCYQSDGMKAALGAEASVNGGCFSSSGGCFFFLCPDGSRTDRVRALD